MTSPSPTPLPPTANLHALVAAYAQAKDEADAATERLDELKSALKIAMFDAGGDAAGALSATHPTLSRTFLLQPRKSWRLDQSRLKAFEPELYIRYTSERITWELREVK